MEAVALEMDLSLTGDKGREENIQNGETIRINKVRECEQTVNYPQWIKFRQKRKRNGKGHT